MVPVVPKIYVEQHIKSLKLRVLGKKTTTTVLFSVGVEIQNYGSVSGEY